MTTIAPSPAEAPAEAPAKKGRQTKPAYRAEGAPKLTEVPEDFNANVHAALKEDDFDESKLDVFYDLKADGFKAKEAAFREKAEAFRRIGAVGDKKTAQKLIDGVAEMKALVEKLVAQGMDPSALLPEGQLAMLGFKADE